MTVLELAIFMCVQRAEAPCSAAEVVMVLSAWSQSGFPVHRVAARLAAMVKRGWLVAIGERVRTSVEGRAVARPILVGLVQMFDRGTSLIDVALMMSVLRLTREELDDGDTDH